MTTLRVFRIARNIYRATVAHCGEDAPATRHLRACLDHLGRGCHTYHHRPKAEHYSAAREAAAAALVALLVDDSGEESKALAEQIEQELMGPFIGLIRTTEKKNHRSRFQQFGRGG